MSAEQTNQNGHHRFWRWAFFSAEVATLGSLALALYLDVLTRPLWRTHTAFMRPYWIAAGVCALLLLVCSIAVRRYDRRLCRLGLYSLFALPFLVQFALLALRAGRVY